jgi:hypothetical protein
MSLNIDKLISELLEAKKKKSSSETEDEPEVVKTPKQSRKNQSKSDEEPSLEAAKKAYEKQKEMLDKGVAKGTITPEERDTGLRDFKRATLRKNNLPNDTELEAPSDTPSDKAADASPANTEFNGKDRLQTLAGIKQDGETSTSAKKDDTPSEPATNTTDSTPPQVTTMADKSDTQAAKKAPAAKKAAPAKKAPPAKKAAPAKKTRPAKKADTKPPVDTTSPSAGSPPAAQSEPAVPASPTVGGVSSTSSTGVTGAGTPVKFTPKPATTAGTPSTELSADEKERLAKAGFRGKELGTSAPSTPSEPSAAEPAKAVQPWSKQGQEMRAQQMAAQAADRASRMATMSPAEKSAEEERERVAAQRDKDASMRRLGFRPEPRGVGDRLRSAWKAFTAKPGDTVGIDKGYRSVFAEIQRLMEQLNMVEHILATESIEEGLVGGQKRLDVVEPFGKLTAADFAKLRTLRKEIRSALVEQIVREELYNHNTTLAELNINQRNALMETVNGRSKKMWEALNEMRTNEPMEEGNAENKAKKDAVISRAGRSARINLMAFDRQTGNPYAALDTKDIDNTRDNKRVGRRLSKFSPEPSGLYSEESYTLEEWMGMMEESGLSPELLARYRAKAAAQKSAIKDKYHGTTSPTTGQTYSRDMHGLPPEATAAGDLRKFQKRTAGIAQANQNIGQQAGKAAASGNNSVFSKLDYRDDELGAGSQWQIDRARKSALSQPTGQPKMAAESINENTVSRLQQLAGITPTE